MRILFALVLFSFFACDSKPKVIVEDTTTQPTDGTMPANNPSTTVPGQESAQGTDVHQVKAVEILQAEKYTYMKVVENADTFWIAASKMDAAKGRSYFYRGGLLKTNFESQEFNRTFDKIFLVSQIIDASAHPGGSGQGGATPSVADVDIKKVAGIMSLSTLLAQPAKHAGKAIVVGGKVVKVNNGIMGKNWIHIQDGTSIKGKKCDLAITTQENIPMGATVAFEGKIFVDKDFGAGYRYDIIMEEAVVKK